MVPEYTLQAGDNGKWVDCGESNHRYDPIRARFLKLAKSMQEARAPGQLRVVDKARSYTPVYDEWEAKRQTI